MEDAVACCGPRRPVRSGRTELSPVDVVADGCSATTSDHSAEPASGPGVALSLAPRSELRQTMFPRGKWFVVNLSVV